ncbi:probable ATP-dependent RNA helicase DDX28 [Coccinella septempunctata]|uniref:probable ATP-dependent RNA helicase DDX28 n=1 Tax=Coccinella septempunctata TaxID=41139 RepID=UPI001D0736E1|nr:probable ATP-dependent RNA helicase DDX28 [Coccinella septempunctata]
MQPIKIFHRFFRTGATHFKKQLYEKKDRHCLITCKNSKLNHYLDTRYSNVEPVPLASKGWNHPKSKGDYFMINPIEDVDEHKRPNIPFSECNIMPELVKTLEAEGIKYATKFQAEAMPELFQGNHVLIGAETGCGKTICYLLPLLQTISTMKDSTEALNSPRVLILVPNRELAYQVGEMAKILSKPLDLKVKILTGGRTKKYMMNPEFEKIDVMVATPGAIGKLSTVGIYKLQNVQHTVLDEADTLTDDSFDERVSGILRKVSQSRIILVSATLPKYLPDSLKPIEPNLVEVISPEIHRPLLHVSQKFLRIPRSGKVSHLLQIAKANKDPLLIFTNRNDTCNWVAMFLRENGEMCSNINGDMNYAIRIQQWSDFVEGRTRILSATDVGSRGLDTVQIRHVVNYEFPLYAADYLHRIGRVGRIGSPRNCKVTNLLCGGQEIELVQQIELALRRGQALTNVDGNITNVIQRKFFRKNRDVV